MVNFENDAIVNVPAKKLVTLIYLQRSEWLQDAWEQYYIQLSSNIDEAQSKGIVKARLISLFKRLRPVLIASLKEDAFRELDGLIRSDDVLSWETATDMLEDFLYNKNITKIDMSKPYDPSDIEAENKMYGL